ncbi:MAG: cysteine desulfurase [Candidatus Saccharimonadales bacterium]|jgi:cysteine desulfurase
MKRIYLDSAAATPVDKRVLAAMEPYFTEIFYNPSALYEGARTASFALEDARRNVAKTIGSRPSEVLFTSGGTESANMAIHGVMRQYPDAELIVSSIEHDAVLKPAEKYNLTLVDVDNKGRIILADLETKITDKTVLISVMLANNEVGTVQPISDITALVADIRANRKAAGNTLPLLVHTDACQAPLYLEVNVARLGVDLLTLNGGKMHGPKQSGILYLRAGVVIEPILYGGGQEFGLRSGTENVAFAVGFAEALIAAQKGRNQRSKKVSEMRDTFMAKLEDELGAEITGHRKHRLANNIHALFPGADNERVLFSLDDQGVDAAAGSACSASKDTSSHVLLAMDYSDEQARSSIRLSINAETTDEDIEKAVEALKVAITA